MSVHQPSTCRPVLISFMVAMISLLACGPGSATDRITTPRGNVQAVPHRPRYAPDRLVFKLRESVAERDHSVSWASKERARRLQDLAIRNRLVQTGGLFRASHSDGLRDLQVAYLPPDTDIQVAMERLRDDPQVEWVEPDYYRYTSYVEPNDPLYWDAQFGQTHLDRIEAQNAWDHTTGDPRVIIAIIDTGVSYNHEDLFDNVWVNPGEVADRNGDRRTTLHDIDLNGDRKISRNELNAAADGLDNDRNGYTDDIMGWDFVDDIFADDVYPGEDREGEDNDPDDFQGHGTLVAGTAAAVGNNGIGVAGVTWGCQIMILRAGYSVVHETAGSHGQVPATLVCAAIRYAAENGADIINISSGGYDACHYELASLEYASDHGCVVVAAAGNEASDGLLYPSSYESVVSVASTDSLSDAKADFSNFGPCIDVAAPGVDIGTTALYGGYKRADGTSLSSPIVAGIAALTKSIHPGWDRQQIVNQLVATADRVDQENPSFVGMLGAGRINARRAVGHPFLGPRPELVGKIAQYTDEQGPAGTRKARLYATIRNFGCRWGHITARLRSMDPHVTVQDGEDTASYGIIQSQRRTTNATDPYVLSVDQDILVLYRATFALDIYVNAVLVAIEQFELPVPPFRQAFLTDRPTVALNPEGITTDPSSVRMSWQIPKGGYLPLSLYHYAIGRMPGETDIRGWRSVPSSGTVDLRCTPLIPHQQYYVTMKRLYDHGYADYLGLSNPVVYVPIARKASLALSTHVYRGSDIVGVRVADLNLQGHVTSHVTVTTDGGDQETVSLTEWNTSGVFDGAIETSSHAKVVHDGALQVRHGETLTVTYDDADDGTGDRAAVVQVVGVDAEPPVVSLSHVRVDQTLRSRATIVFDTDEPACGTVHYGTAAGALDKTAVGMWDASHFAVDLVDLVPGRTYVFAVEACDEAGNRTMDDNHGRGYPLRAAVFDALDRP